MKMMIVVDTSALWGLLNKHDQYHQRAKRRHRELRSEASFTIPRITFIETMGHITRNARDAQTRLDGLRGLVDLGWVVEEHEPRDFDQTNLWWKQYADWPIEYPDALILSTAVRLKAGAVWLFDKEFTRFVRQAAPKIKPIGSGFVE